MLFWMPMKKLASSANSGNVLPENPRTQSARPEFSVFQSGVSSSIAETTYPGEKFFSPVKCSEYGDAETIIGKRRDMSVGNATRNAALKG